MHGDIFNTLYVYYIYKCTTIPGFFYVNLHNLGIVSCEGVYTIHTT